MAVPAGMGNMTQAQFDAVVNSTRKAQEQFKANAEANKNMHNPESKPRIVGSEGALPVQSAPMVQHQQIVSQPQQGANDYIQQLNNAKQQAIFAQLDKSKQGALSGLAEERAGVKPRYYDSRNATAAGSQQSQKKFG